MFYVLYVVILYCLVPSETSDDPKKLRIALQTVLDFGSKGGNHDPQTLEYFRKFIDQIKVAVDKSWTNQANQAKQSAPQSHRKTSNDKHMKFSDFLQKSIVIINKLDDQGMEKLLDVVSEEARKYNYKGCKFSELVQNPNLRRTIHNSLDVLQTIPIASVRKTLDNIHKKLKGNNLSELEKQVVNFMDALYDKRHVGKMEDSLRSLASYQKNSKSHSRKNLGEFIRKGLRALVFDHFSEMADIGRDILKHNIESLYETATAQTTTKGKISDNSESSSSEDNSASSKKEKKNNDLTFKARAKYSDETNEDNSDGSDKEDQPHEEEQPHKVSKDAPMRFISLYEEDRKPPKSTTRRMRISSAKRHKKAKTEKKKRPISSASVEETRTTKSKTHHKSKLKKGTLEKATKKVTTKKYSSSSLSESAEESTTKPHTNEKVTKKVVAKNKHNILSSSLSDEKPWLDTAEKHIAKKTTRKATTKDEYASTSNSDSAEEPSSDTNTRKNHIAGKASKSHKNKPSSSFSQELWLKITPKHKGRTASQKHEKFFGISLSSLSSEDGMTTKRTVKKIRKAENQRQFQNKKKSKSKAKTQKKTGQKHRQRFTEDDNDKSQLRENKISTSTATTSNILWDIGVSLFNAAIHADSTTDKRTRDEDNISGDNKAWLGTSRKSMNSLMQLKKIDGTHDQPMQKKKAKRTETSNEYETSYTKMDSFKDVRRTKSARELSVERGFIQSLVKAEPIKATTKTKSTQEERRKTPPIQHNDIIPPDVDAEETNESSETSDSDISTLVDDRMDNGLSIEAYTPYNYRRQLDPDLLNKLNIRNPYNLTLDDVENIMKETYKRPVSYPILSQKLQNVGNTLKETYTKPAPDSNQRQKIINVRNYNNLTLDDVEKLMKETYKGTVPHPILRQNVENTLNETYKRPVPYPILRQKIQNVENTLNETYKRPVPHPILRQKIQNVENTLNETYKRPVPHPILRQKIQNVENTSNLRQKIKNLETLVQELKDKVIDNATCIVENKSVYANESLYNKPILRTNNDSTKSNKNSTTAFLPTSPTEDYSKVPITTTSANTVFTTHSGELFDISKMNMKNQSLVEILKPIVKFADNYEDFSNFISNGNATEQTNETSAGSRQSVSNVKPIVNTTTEIGANYKTSTTRHSYYDTSVVSTHINWYK